jgi:GNAT superfamily N-acetyltransferase
MVNLTDISLPSSARGHLRPIQPHRDMPEVADLIELCFKDTLDPSGHSYLRHLRQAASESQVLHWASSAAEILNGLPISGLVWDEAGRIVGNLSLIPILHWRKRITLIANVAVHPDFRGRGIARSLTTTALEYLRQRQMDAVWLQVRDDNGPAIHIYRALGFTERARRTTWVSQDKPAGINSWEGAVIGKRLPEHWEKQLQWLKRLYPDELRWYLPIRWSVFRPGLFGGLARFFTLDYPQHWTIQRSKKMLAAITSLYETGKATTLWLAAPPDEELELGAVQAVLETAMAENDFHRPFSMNLPAGFAAEAIRAAGFVAQQTLIWMQIENEIA